MGGNDKKISNSLLVGRIERFNTMFDDLQSTFLAIGKLLRDPQYRSMSDYTARQYGNLRDQINVIKGQFYGAINNINLNEGASMNELDNAFKAYVNKDAGFLPGKYARQLKRLLKKVPLPNYRVRFMYTNKYKYVFLVRALNATTATAVRKSCTV